MKVYIVKNAKQVYSIHLLHCESKAVSKVTTI